MAALIPGLQNLNVTADSLAAMDAIGASVAAATDTSKAGAAASTAARTASPRNATATAATTAATTHSVGVRFPIEEGLQAAAVRGADRTGIGP